MIRFRTPGLVAAGGLALLAGCKHHHQPYTDVPVVHAPLMQPAGMAIQPGGMMMVQHPETAIVPGAITAGPMPRPYLPPSEPATPEAPAPLNPVGVLPAPAEYPKIPSATPQGLPGKPDGSAIGLISPGGERPSASLVPLPKQPGGESPATGPTLTGLPASGTPDPFVAAPNRMFGPAAAPEIVNAPRETSPELQPMKLKAGERFGHSADYKWVAGVLDKHQRGGFWTLRYADYASDDVWGGKVRLVDDPRLSGFRNGDYVYIEGDLLAPSEGTADAAGYPPYRVNILRSQDKGR